MRQFLKQALATLIGSFAGLVLFSIVGTGSLFLLFVIIGTRDQQPQVESDSVLVFDLSKSIQDTQPPLNITQALFAPEERPVTVQQVVNSIEKASEDDRISGILLDGTEGSNTTDYAILQEIREALVEFQESGKEVIAYDTNLNQREYYLASVADNVILNPLGNLEIRGLRSEQTFFAGAFEQYGIGIDTVRVGDYKSAIEPLIREDLSPENEEQLTALLGDIWGEWLEDVSTQRDISVDELQNIVDTQGILLAENALEAGLVDEVAYRDEVISQLKEISETEDDDDFPNISLASYSGVTQREAMEDTSDNEIAVLHAQGAIVGGEAPLDSIGSSRYAQKIRNLRENDDVKAVVLRINSPGGGATASDVILRELKLTQEEKPVIVSMGDTAASGAYWVSLGGDKIFAQPTTVTGSIGVFGILPNIQELANENGITWDEVATGELAGLDSISRAKSEEELAILQGTVDQIYDRFIDRVADNRDLSPEEVEEIAQGRVWSGKQAQEVGLVDELGGLNSALAQAAETAELEDWQVQEYPRLSGFEERFLRRFQEDARVLLGQETPIDERLKRFQNSWEEFKVMNDPNHAYARLPFEFHID
ncbi:signal peptide peptidase SppA [Euhalothece natronophila Z-M001]|uniref:Protease 4 n=1 Tax=Euhalothece natronophila Z-M001 TaxID=522448 RepID=A0A5B8NHT7_9CHRO|nr:signal peptide peptidase SppA [Euhalothece natronophila]QDZ38752.1 signal peptide peptidase SppA [Euhalothece natronophila Z-M001]